MTHENDERLVAWLADGPAHGPTANLERAFSATRGTRQRPAWLVAARGGTIAAERTTGQLRFGLVAIAVLVITLIAGALIAGGLLPKPHPIPSPLVIASPDPSPDPSAALPESGRIVYTRWRSILSGEEDCDLPGRNMHCFRAAIFTSRDDGSDEQELFPEPWSDLVAMSPDGSRLIVSLRQEDGDFLYMTDADGSEPQPLDTNCEFPCVGDGGYAFSPDGTRLAFTRSIAEDPETLYAVGTVIAVMDFETGAVVELESTFASNPDLGDPCHNNCGDGDNGAPSWSPDGAHLLFSRGNIGDPNDPLRMFLDRVLYVVDADGGNLRQLVPGELRANDARWSPDGSLIVFTSAIEALAAPGIDNWQEYNDIYAVRPDGTGLQRLTTDMLEPVGTTEPGEFGARFPSWTRDGRIVFTRNAAPGETLWQLWVMDSDGGNATRLDPSDPVALTAVGCIACPYPGVDPFVSRPSPAFWIPAP